MGYTTNTTTGKKYLCLGPAFTSVAGTAGNFQLKDFVPNGFNYEGDELRIINPASGGTLVALSYIWESDGFGVTGWWDMSSGDEYNDRELQLGTGFKTSYNTKGDITAQNSGLVYTEAPSIDCTGNKYQVVPNPLPYAVKFKDITVEGFDYEKDEFRIILPSSGGVDVVLSYLYEADGFGVTGWWDMSSGDEYNNLELPMGGGLLLSSGSKTVVVTFPKAIED